MLLRRAASALVKAGVFICLVLITIEISAQILLSDKIANLRIANAGPAGRQVYLYTPGSLRNQSTYPSYKPDAEVELRTYFPDAAGNLTLEYECTYRTDALGFASNDAKFQDSQILILGESFTVGLGGCDWLSGLDRDVRSKVYAAAHPGLGPAHWRDIVADLEKLGKVQSILIIMITDDVFRRLWKYSDAAIACLDRQSTCDGQIHLPITDDADRVLAERSRQPTLSVLGRLKYYFPASAALVSALKPAPAEQSEVMKASVDILKRLSSKYKTKIIWVSEWREVVTSVPWTAKLARELEGLDVHRCRLPAEGFLPRDRHPNAAGYSVLRDCVEATIRAW